jgi:hypothetical protein
VVKIAGYEVSHPVRMDGVAVRKRNLFELAEQGFKTRVAAQKRRE